MWQDSTTGQGQWRLEGVTSCEDKEDSDIRLNVKQVRATTAGAYTDGTVQAAWTPLTDTL